MVYLHLPAELTEDEVQLQAKYKVLRKKRKAWQASRAPKVEKESPISAQDKKAAEAAAAADATEKAKKLLQSGAIKVVERKEPVTFKRTKRAKINAEEPDTPSTPTVDSTPFSPPQEFQGEERAETERPRVKGLYESFVSSREGPSSSDTKGRDKPERRPFLPTPSKGNTIYVSGYGVTEDILKSAFARFGRIVNINMERDKNCGFVTFDQNESAESAIQEMRGTLFGGVELSRVSLARRQPIIESTGTGEQPSSWTTIAASNSQKGVYKDQRELVVYTEDDIFN